jgi:predicted TIM-barrel fold metal-dependent hydrolase
MIIDCHCHAGPGDANTAPWNSTAKLEPFLTWSAEAGIRKTVVFPVFTHNSEKANRELAKIVRGHRGRLIGFAWINPKRDSGRIARLLQQAIGGYGFRGIKVHGSQAMPNRELCLAAARWRVPILVDVFGHAEVVDMLAREFPHVDFIIPHFGSFADDFRAQSRVAEQIARYPNVYADTSGVRRFEYLQEGVRRAGAHKVLFGTDGPWLHPAVEIAKVKALKLPAADEARILGGNLVRLLRKRRLAQTVAA